MVDVVISIAAKVAELMVVPIGKHICYPFKYNSNMDALKKQVEKLKGEGEMLQHSVDEAKRQGDEIEKVVEKWLTKVDEFTEGVVKPIIDDQDKAGKLCSIGFCPNLMTRYYLSKKAAKTTKDGLDLLGEGKFGKVSYRPLLRKTISTYIRDDYEDFDSRTPIFQKIMQSLKDDNSKMIGVYGMGGVGKTTLVKGVVAQAIEDKLFDFEIMVDITESPDIKKIQEQIADHLGLNFHEESLPRRAVRLRDRLKKEKKVLIVLDNIWAKLDLEDVGIPFGHEEKGRNDDQRRCKLLLTSRNAVVLSNDMNAEKNFLVEILSEEEAGNLFWKIVGESAKNCDFEAIGVEIIQYCAGLPVAIATIASALKKKSLFDWKDALDQLRRSNPRHIKGMDANVYSALKLSYDFLEREEAKSLFLLCSLENASTDISFNYLLRYCMGLGLFQNVYTLEQGRNRLHTLINHLKASCLLLDGNTNGYVKMHDIIHAVAASIASTDKLMFNIQDVTDLKERLEELPKDSTAISLFRKDVSMLPERLAYPKLKLFFLVMEEFSLQIPDTFFEGMEELKVLDTTKIHMLSLPSSLSKLTNLQTLCLDKCQLRNVAIIGELKRLEILCFWGSDIEELPTQIGRLTRLRLLELSKCSNLKVISPNVISSLTRLEELYMGNSFIQWEVEGQSNASLSELKQLSCLTSLEIHVLDAQVMPQDLMIFEKLERYKIIIGDAWEWKWFPNYEASRALKLKLNNSIYLRNGIKILLGRTEDLYLDELKGVKNIIYQLDGEGFPQLKHLHVQNGSEIQYIVNSIGQDQGNVFPMLQSLFLHNLINLEKICHGQLATKSFNKLKSMKIGRCDGLKHLFSFSIAKNLLQLQEIEVTYCKKLEEIVFKESHEQFQQNDSVSKFEFTQLRRLRLKHLPKLTSFCNFEGKSIELPSLNHLLLENCPKMHAFVSDSPDADMPTNKGEQVNSEQSLHANIQPLFDEKVRIPNVKDLRIKEMNMKKIWHHDQLTSDSFSKIDYIGVYDCHNLLNIFPSNMHGRLQKIETLAIERCNSLEEIFEELKISSCMMEEIVAKEDLEAVPRFVFPQLQWLQLVDLPSLRSFYSGVYISEWPKLKKLRMWGCNKVEIFTSEFLSFQKSRGKSQLENSIQEPLFIVDKVAFPEVEKLTLGWNWIVKEILHGQFSEYSCNLKVLQLLNASKQSAICPYCFLYTLPNLERLDVYYEFFEEIFICEVVDCKEKHVEAPSKLNYLSLVGLKDSSFVWEENSLPSRVFRNLTTLEVSKCDNLQILVPSFVSFQNLTTLEVSNCNGLVNLLAVSVAKSLVQLTRLKITECKMIEKIVTQGRVDETEDMIIFNQLKYLELHCLPRLTSFCSDNYAVEFPFLQQVVVGQCQSMRIFSQGALSTPRLHKLQITKADEEGIWKGDLNTTIKKMFKEMVGFRGIEELTLFEFPHLKEVWHNQFPISFFGSLKSLVVDDDCSNLRYIFTSSVALGLVQLQELEIKNSVVLEAIIVIEEERTDNTLFPNLTRLELKDLPKLLRFCNFLGNSIELPSLARLCIDNCPNIETFISGSTDAEMPASKENLHTDIQPLFNEKIRLPNLKVLILDKMDKLGKIWHHQLTSDSFCKLESLEVYNCHNVLIVFPSNMLGRLQKLDKLWLRNCSSLDEIFEIQASSCGKTQAITATQLRKLELNHLPKLKHVWNMDSQGLLSFPNLLSIKVKDCDTLKSIFPASVGRNLLHLEELWIDQCCMVEEIFAKEEEMDEVVPRFPQLTFLRLAELSRLQSFYPMVQISEWPMLERLQIWNCDKVEISASKFLSFQVTDGESQHDMPMGQPLLLLDKVPFTNLERLGLDWKWIEKEALHEKLPEYSCKLKSLTFNGFHKGTDICVFCFLNKLPNIEELQVTEGFFKEVFLSEGLGCEEEHVEAPSKLSKLRLFDMYDSLHLWEEKSLCSKVFQNLAILEVVCCNSLKSLVPSHVSFQNLTTLEVIECNKILNLVTVSTAKSLVQLTKLSISECKMIEEIIIHEGDEVEDWIIFKKLRYVKLGCLPSLVSFYSGNYTIELSSLRQVVVRECPKMQIFSRGILNTPRLHKLQTTEAEDYGFWEGDLNTTIEHLSIENGQSSKEN